MTKSTTFTRSGVSASAVMLRSTWFAANTGIFVSCDTRTGSSFTFSSRAYSLASSQAGPVIAGTTGVLHQPGGIGEHADAQHAGLADGIDTRTGPRRGRFLRDGK